MLDRYRTTHIKSMAESSDADLPSPPPSSPGNPPIHLAGGVITMLVGAAVLLGGIILHFGEKADRLVIFPFAGRLTILLGIVILATGAAFAGRRAGLVLGALMVIGGLVLYGFGLAYVQQLGTRLYQLFGLLTTLIGLVVVYTFFGMSDVINQGPAPPGSSHPGPSP
jgi:hypothetical protein